MNLLFAEQQTPGDSEINNGRLEAIWSIKSLLSQIDHSVEKLPLEDSQRFIGLLTSLKGVALNNEERQLAKEISG